MMFQSHSVIHSTIVEDTPCSLCTNEFRSIRSKRLVGRYRGHTLTDEHFVPLFLNKRISIAHISRSYNIKVPSILSLAYTSSLHQRFTELTCFTMLPTQNPPSTIVTTAEFTCEPVSETCSHDCGSLSLFKVASVGYTVSASH